MEANYGMPKFKYPVMSFPWEHCLYMFYFDINYPIVPMSAI